MENRRRRILYVITTIVLGISFFVASLVFGAEFDRTAQEARERNQRIEALREMRAKNYTIDVSLHKEEDVDSQVETEKHDTVAENEPEIETTEAVAKEDYEEEYVEEDTDSYEEEYYEEPVEDANNDYDDGGDDSDYKETATQAATDPADYDRPPISNDGWTYLDRPYFTGLTIDDGALSGGSYGATSREAFLLACLVSCEAGWAPYETQVMVADTVLYRASLDYGGDIEAAIYSPGQFWTDGMDRYIENGPYQNAVMASQAALNGEIYGSTHYYYFWSADYALANWDWLMERGYSGEFIGGDDGDFFFN